MGRTWQVRDLTAEDWADVGISLGLDPDDALSRVERLRVGLPEAVAAAADEAPEPFLGDARRVAQAVARQGHLKARHLPWSNSAPRLGDR